MIPFVQTRGIMPERRKGGSNQNFMLYKIFDHTKTLNCKGNLQCLTNRDYQHGIKIIPTEEKEYIIIIDCKEVCEYNLRYGNQTICRCPLRNTIYTSLRKT